MREAGTVAITVQQPTPWLLDEFNTDPRMRRFINRLDTAEVIASPYVPIDLRALELAGVIERADALYARGVETLTTVLGSEPITTRFLSRSEPTLSEARLLHTRGVRDLVARADRVDIDGPVEIQTGEGTLRALTVPSWFSDASPDDPVLGAHHLLAELAVMAIATDHETSAVVLFGTDTPFDDTFIDELLAGLTASSVIDPVSLSEAAAVPQLVNGIGLPISLAPPDGDDTTLPGDLALYLEAVDDLSSYRSMISDEDTHHVYDELNDRLLIGLGRGVSATDRNILARSTIAQVRVETGAVEAPPLRGVNLTSRQATAPFSFRNNASYPLRVEVRFLADKARFVDFDDGETTTLVLEPGITNWEFRVQALAAGSFPLRIEMFSPDGALELDAVDLTMRSTVPSGVGVALTIGAVVVLVAWWGRDLLRGRRVAA